MHEAKQMNSAGNGHKVYCLDVFCNPQLKDTISARMASCMLMHPFVGE
jgi:hypothetical protein